MSCNYMTSLVEEHTEGRIVDRFNKLFLRTLRALRDLRRYAPTVMIQNAGQVNIGQQHVNAAQIQSEV